MNSFRSFFQWRCAVACALAAGIPASAVGAHYVVVSSESTFADTAWKQVTDALKQKHAAVVMTYTGPAFPETLRQALAQELPSYICFVAKPEEASESYVRACHQLARALDDDEYGDAIWGIVTGFDADDAMRLALQGGPLSVRNVLLKSGGQFLEWFYSGQYHGEMGEPHPLWTRAEGGAVARGFDTSADDTLTLVNTLNSNQVHLMLTSGHASEYNWQLHYPDPSPEGFFVASNGRLYGRDANSVTHLVNSTNPKIYWAAGNCLIAKIPGDSRRDNCMALAWLGSGGAAQMAGYVVETMFGYMGWGVGDYFIQLQGRYNFAESVHLANQGLIFDGRKHTPGVNRSGLIYDRDVFVLYGDPAFDARVKPVKEALYDMSLQHTQWQGKVDFTLSIRLNQAENLQRPLIARLPFRIQSPTVINSGLRPMEVADDMVIVRLWQEGEAELQASQTWTLRFSGSVPDPTTAAHSADFRTPLWAIDGTEVSRVLAYWRAGAYHIHAGGADGFAPGAGSTAGPRHSADYQEPFWAIDSTEVSRVLAYWRAGAYHPSPSGADGFAPGPASGGATPHPAVVLLARYLGVPTASVVVLQHTAVQWGDSSLACPRQGMVYLPIMTPGEQITCRVGNSTYDVRTGFRNAILCLPGNPIDLGHLQ